MIKIKNILTYAICMFFMFILSINSVYAMTFYQDGELHYNDSFELCSGCNHMTFIKHAENGDYAYCGAQNLSFRGPSGRPNSNYVYKKDKSWSNAGGCSYYVAKKDENGKFVKDKNGKVKYQKKRGDCSVILGYIIKKDYKKACGYEGLMLAQGSVWTYLGTFTYGPYSYNNGSPNDNWESNSTIRSVLYKAWKAYSNNKDEADRYREVDESNMIGVKWENNDSKLYYVPENNCGKGHYKSNKITITNNCKSCDKVDVKISSSNNGVKLYTSDSDAGQGTLTAQLLKYDPNKTEAQNKNATITFYLKSNKPYSSQNEFHVSASYITKVKKTTTKSIPDTVRYEYKNDPGSYQSLYVMKKSSAEDNINITTEYSFDDFFKFSFLNVTHKGCDNSNSSVIYYTSNSQQNKLCLNNTNNVNDTSVNFAACTCKVLDLNGKKVGIYVTEKTNFQYGTFAPNFVYPGGGFAFSESNGADENGTPTKYNSKIQWNFADYYNNKPYYYDNGKVGDATVFTGNVKTDLDTKIKRSSLKLNVVTQDSNNSTFSSAQNYNHVIPFEIPLKVDNLKYDDATKTFSAVINNVKLKEAYFSTDGVVGYTANPKYISGGNKYYVPIKYMNKATEAEGKFPFNIVNTNLSLSGYFEFNYGAKCYEKVKNYNLKFKYRPISESRPFPTSIPDNWNEWYDARSNQDRITNSFNSSNLLYSINLGTVDFSKLQRYKKSYTNWDYVSPTGVDNVVKNEFNKKANSSSYCPIGKFDSSCDK